MSAPLPVDWPAARRAVAEAAPRLTSMLREIDRPDAPALGSWDVTGLASHVSHGMDIVTAMSNGAGNLLPDVASQAAMTRMLVEGEGRRPLPELADRIDASVARFLAAMEAAGDDGSQNWLFEGTAMPLSGLTCHMLNELTVHGYDIARAVGRPWPIDRGHATLIMTGFVIPGLHGLRRQLVVQERAGDKRVRFEIHMRGDGRFCMRFHDGEFSAEASPQGPVDCHLSVDPEAFLLVAWGRINQWQAIPKGKLLAWGRKPWLGLQMRSWLRNP